MADMTAQDLAAHLQMLRETDEEQRDRLLHALLVAIYATPEAQDS